MTNISIKVQHVFTTLCVLLIILQFCLSEALPPSRANITPVKLYHFHSHPKNLSSSMNKKVDLAFGSVAKISRVVPLKQLSKLKYNFRSNSKSNQDLKIVKASKIAKSKSKSSSKQPKRNNGTRSSSRYRLRHERRKSKEFTTEVSTTQEPSSTTPLPDAVAVSSESESEFNSSVTEPAILSANPWGYLRSSMRDVALGELITDIDTPNEITVHSVLQVGDKQSRMLELDENNNTINTGVRFSSKMRPILNVTPLEQIGYDDDVKQLKSSIIKDHRNMTGHISNGKQAIPMRIFYYKTEEPPNSPPNDNDITADQSMMDIQQIAPNPNPSSTTPSLMEVLSVPHVGKVDATTTPFSPPDLVEGFNPVFHQSDIAGNQDNFQPTLVPTRKARGPPTEEEYQLPSITTTSTVEPETIRSYQTILETTTVGPKVIWYNHQQTPEDTFYPNSDGYLVPPDEPPLDILSDSMTLAPIQTDLMSDLSSKNLETFSTEYGNNNDIVGTFTYAKGKAWGDEDSYASSTGTKNARGYGSNRGSRLSSSLPSEQGMKMTKTSTQMQPAAAATVIDHDGIREIYIDEFRTNGGSSGKRTRQEFLPQPRQKERERGQYGSASYHADIKDHEIVPRQQKPYSEIVDTASYPAAFNEYQDHHHYPDSYPPSPSPIRDEISSSQPNSYQQRPNSGSATNYYKEEGSQSPYRDEPSPSTELDYYNRRPSADGEKNKESSPSGGYGYHHGHGHGHGHGGYGHGHHHHGHNDHANFFSKAKEYFKNSDFSTAEKWFDVTIGVLAFLAFGGYIIMLLYQVFTISSGTTLGAAFGKSFRGAGELFDVFFSKSPLGQEYMDELETVVKRAMANVKRSWVTNSFAESGQPVRQVKGEVDLDKK